MGDCVGVFMGLWAKEWGGGGERLIVQRQGKGRSVWCHIPPGTAAGEGEASGKEAQAAPGYFLG